jgi:hypothetical protein
MSYSNRRYEGRLVLIPHAQSAFATLHVGIQPVDSIKSVLEGAETKQLYQVEEIGSSFTSEISTISRFCFIRKVSLGMKPIHTFYP